MTAAGATTRTGTAGATITAGAADAAGSTAGTGTADEGAAGGATLAAEGLVKRYGSRLALDGFTLTAQPGEIVGLVGHNGAGKTTFVTVVSGLTRPDAGRVTVAGVDALAHPRAARRLLSVCPQETALYPQATVAEHLRLFGALAGLRRAALSRTVADIAGRLRLGDVLDRPAGVLSGGQRKRAQAATALIADGPLLLLDEPTAGADPQTRRALLTVVAERAAAGTAVLYTTHYLPELAELGATLAVARAGRIIARGSQRELLAGLPGEVIVGFGGPVPPGLRRFGQVDGGTGDQLRVITADPPAALGRLLAAGAEPVSFDIRRPGLDDLYDSLTCEARDDAA
jgi:ABC-2 type transport system ATP-binding protein